MSDLMQNVCVRRSLTLALVGGMAVLLLLASLPPPVPLLMLFSPPTLSASSNTTNTTILTTSATSHNNTKQNNHLVITKDLYEAGHIWAHPELCPHQGTNIELLILITSAPDHSTQRAGIRLTWGHYTLRKDVIIAFFLGRPPDDIMKGLSEEDALYGDIIMGASMDSYSNLTLKALSMLEWKATYCPQARKLLKTDDDMFINVPQLLAFIAHPKRVNASKTIWGRVAKKWLPFRSPNSKYYLSELQYPHKTFPDFTTGPAYLMTSDAVRPLLAAAPAQPYLRLEDVFITGVLAEKTGVRRENAEQFYNKQMPLEPCVVQRGISIHMVQYHQQFDLWRMLLDLKTV